MTTDNCTACGGSGLGAEPVCACCNGTGERITTTSASLALRRVLTSLDQQRTAVLGVCIELENGTPGNAKLDEIIRLLQEPSALAKVVR